MIRFVDWFSGVGGFRLGLERAGAFRCVAHSEIDAYACAVYRRHWPGSLNLGDINLVQTRTIPEADLWTGGFPCQPFSVAGKRLGADDERNLWPAWFELIRVVRPRYLLLENVPALLADQYMLTILGDLVSCGYDADGSVVPTGAFGSHFLGERMYVFASSAPTDCKRLQRGGPFNCKSGETWSRGQLERLVELELRNAVPAGSRGRVSDGVPNRVDRLKGLGNAVVPTVVTWIGEQIKCRHSK